MTSLRLPSDFPSDECSPGVDGSLSLSLSTLLSRGVIRGVPTLDRSLRSEPCFLADPDPPFLNSSPSGGEVVLRKREEVPAGEREGERGVGRGGRKLHGVRRG